MHWSELKDLPGDLCCCGHREPKPRRPDTLTLAHISSRQTFAVRDTLQNVERHLNFSNSQICRQEQTWKGRKMKAQRIILSSNRPPKEKISRMPEKQFKILTGRKLNEIQEKTDKKVQQNYRKQHDLNNKETIKN